MKQISSTLVCLLFASLAFSQNQSAALQAAPVSKISITTGQKISVISDISADASMMGMNFSNKANSNNTLEVKNITDRSFILTNTVTHLKMDVDMMGQSTSYDSDKKEDRDSDIGKTVSETMNKPEDVTLDILTGKEIKPASPEKEAPGNDASGMMGMFASGSGASIVTNAFLPVAEAKVGATWTDSTVTKEQKTISIYTVKSIDGKNATISLEETATSNGEIEVQGNKMQMNTNTKTTGEIVTDISTGLVSSRNTKSEVTGNVQIMGQEVPVSVTMTATATYK